MFHPLSAMAIADNDPGDGQGHFGSLIMTGLRSGFVAVLCVVASACSTGPASEAGASTPPLGEWQALRVGDRAVAGPSIRFTSDGSTSGTTGCNQFSTKASFEGNDGISFAPTAVTKMACMGGDRMAVEREFLDALSASRRYRNDESRLQLIDAEGRVVLELEPSSASS